MHPAKSSVLLLIQLSTFNTVWPVRQNIKIRHGHHHHHNYVLSVITPITPHELRLWPHDAKKSKYYEGIYNDSIMLNNIRLKPGSRFIDMSAVDSRVNSDIALGDSSSKSHTKNSHTHAKNHQTTPNNHNKKMKSKTSSYTGFIKDYSVNNVIKYRPTVLNADDIDVSTITSINATRTRDYQIIQSNPSSSVPPVYIKPGSYLNIGHRTSAMTKHFHIPHFGMVESEHFSRRTPIDGTYSVEGTFLWAVGLFGTVENGAIVFTLICSRKFRRPLHILVGSLAVTDLFVSVIYIPSYTYFLLGGDKDFTEEENPTDVESYSYCDISRALFIEIASVTLSIKALIALYLYVLTVSKALAMKLFSTCKTILFIILAWSINFVILFLPGLLGYSKVDLYPNTFVCSRGPKVELGLRSSDPIIAMYSIGTLSFHLAELLFTCLCFIRVHRAIMTGKVISSKNRKDDPEARMNYTRATKITILVFISFCVCWMPIYVINVVDPNHHTIPKQVHRVAMDLLLLKSSVNPTIYICGIRSLRQELKLMCMCMSYQETGTHPESCHHNYILRRRQEIF